MCTEVFVLLHHLDLSAPPHQGGADPSPSQVCVQLGRKYMNPPWGQGLMKGRGDGGRERGGGQRDVKKVRSGIFRSKKKGKEMGDRG